MANHSHKKTRFCSADHPDVFCFISPVTSLILKWTLFCAFQPGGEHTAIRPSRLGAADIWSAPSCALVCNAPNEYGVFTPDHLLYYIAITSTLHLHNLIMLVISLKSGQSSL